MSKSMAQIIAERKVAMEKAAQVKITSSKPIDAVKSAEDEQEKEKRRQDAARKKAEKDGEMAALKTMINNLQTQIDMIVSNQRAAPVKALMSPQEYYEYLLKKLNLPLSISAKQLEKAAIPNADDKLFLSRFTRARKELNIFFAGIK